jgi:hypothetical protein
MTAAPPPRDLPPAHTTTANRQAATAEPAAQYAASLTCHVEDGRQANFSVVSR